MRLDLQFGGRDTGVVDLDDFVDELVPRSFWRPHTESAVVNVLIGATSTGRQYPQADVQRRRRLYLLDANVCAAVYRPAHPTPVASCLGLLQAPTYGVGQLSPSADELLHALAVEDIDDVVVVDARGGQLVHRPLGVGI